ncbi:hypothetical protein C8T65DRAFT_694422 [Cerioporus squamosus]|nr:hypothetical protein C8T65DRAFT_694422 [Cerioporus squamosus]
MQLFAFVSLAASFLAVSESVTGVSAALIGSAPLTECKQETVVHSGFIGKDNNVKFQASHCDDTPRVSASGQIVSLDKRQSTNTTNVCGAQSHTPFVRTGNTFCFSGSSGGPNEDDCKVVADALLFDSQNDGPCSTSPLPGYTATDKITMQYGSCLTYFLNQDSSDLTYCRNDWSSLVTWLAGDCNAANGAHGGLCVANDQRWYIQVQNSSG